jgi:hypothetical protein
VTEEEPLEWAEQLLAAERPDATVEPVVLGHDAVVLERSVRRLERIVELVALPEPVAVVVADRAELRVHRPADRPQRTGASVDPDHDPLGGTRVVTSFDDALCESPGRLRSLHDSEYTKSRLPPMARVRDVLRSPFAFLFQRPQSEEIVAEYVVREHRSGRSLGDILDDAYVKNRCSPEQVGRVLDRPEVVRALGDDIAALKRSQL